MGAFYCKMNWERSFTVFIHKLSRFLLFWSLFDDCGKKHTNIGHCGGLNQWKCLPQRYYLFAKICVHHWLLIYWFNLCCKLSNSNQKGEVKSAVRAVKSKNHENHVIHKKSTKLVENIDVDVLNKIRSKPYLENALKCYF